MGKQPLYVQVYQPVQYFQRPVDNIAKSIKMHLLPLTSQADTPSFFLPLAMNCQP